MAKATRTVASPQEVVIAGPGAGKTHNLVETVIPLIEQLPANRYLCIITYTNAATDKIELALARRVRIPANVFVGTIHSFLNRFVLAPFAHLYGLVPADTCFVEGLEVSDPKARNLVNKKARLKGVIPYSQIEALAVSLLCGNPIDGVNGKVKLKAAETKKIAERIAGRVFAMFVDEYQDATLRQHKVLEKLVSVGRMQQAYVVGDPEQYIYGFRYGTSGEKAPNIADIPLRTLATASPPSKNTDNRRCSASLVKFLNQFSDLQQECKSSAPDCGGPFFLRDTDDKSIVQHFEELCGRPGLESASRFYLSYAGQTVQWPTLTTGIAVGNEGSASQLASEMARVVSGLLGYSQRQLRDLAGIDSVALRKLGLKALRKIKLEPTLTCDQARSYAEAELGVKSSSAPRRTQDLERLREIKVTPRENLIQFATIHKSKGLEADAVLVVAQTEAELLKWLQTDRATRDADTQDKCRIGFVAFSRAKSLLCVACLEGIVGSETLLKNLGFELLDAAEEAQPVTSQSELQPA